MNLSTRLLPLLGIPLMTVFAVSCAQSGAGDAASPASPSALSADASAAPLRNGASQQPASSPGASYDASGMWRFVDTDVHGNDAETFDTTVSQDANGNLSFLDEDGNPITLERMGTGVIITYRVSFTGEEDGAEIRVQGTARLDTRTNTLTANILLKFGRSGEHLIRVVTATKLS